MAGQNMHDIRDIGPNGDGRRPNAVTISRGAYWLMAFLSLCAIAFFILLCIWGWGPHRGANYTATTEPAIVAQPVSYYNHGVTTAGTVDKVLGPQEFTIGKGQDGDQLLVLTRHPLTEMNNQAANAPLVAGKLAVVTGTIHKFNRKQTANHMHLTLPENVYGAWEGKPVLIADSVACAPGGQQQAVAH